MNMPFGKHKGTPVMALPSSYIGWALENMTQLRADLRGELAAELAKRDEGGGQRSQDHDDPPARSTDAPAPTVASADVQERARRLIREELAKVLRRAAEDLERSTP